MTAATYAAESADPLCESSDALAAMLADLPYRRFGVVGDSLSAGTGGPVPGYRTLGWSDRVAETLRLARPDTEYLNRAVIGVTTRQVIDGQLDAVLSFEPDLLHVPSGANDLFVRHPDFAAIEAGLRELYERAAAGGAQLTAFTFGRAFVVPSVADWTERVRAVNEITRRLGREHGAVVVDMWDHPVNDREDLVSSDGIHFSAVGQAVMATEAVRSLAAARH